MDAGSEENSTERTNSTIDRVGASISIELTLQFSEAIEKRLAVMDQTAFTMCREHSLPVVVLDFNEPGALVRAVSGERVGTLVGGE